MLQLSKFIVPFVLCLTACTTTIPRKNPLGQAFPEVKGTSLEGKTWTLPKDLVGQKSLLLIGFKQNSQFDIDRWLIGLDQKNIKVNAFEIPTIKGWIPSLIAETIDEGMRSGIPKNLWKVVITVYDDAEQIVNFVGNEDPLNARVTLLDSNGKVLFHHDRGFSVQALNKLGSFLPSASSKGCPC